MRKRGSRIECGSLYLWGTLNDNSDLVEARFSSVRLFLPISFLFPCYNLSHKRNMKTTYEGSSLHGFPVINQDASVLLCRDRFFPSSFDKLLHSMQILYRSRYSARISGKLSSPPFSFNTVDSPLLKAVKKTAHKWSVLHKATTSRYGNKNCKCALSKRPHFRCVHSCSISSS